MKEKLIIKNFAGIDHLEIELNKINILIGPQASGKSITAKLFFYFKSFIEGISQGIQNGETTSDIVRNQTEKFSTYFPSESWSKNNFSIEYSIPNTWMRIIKGEGKILKFEYSESIKKVMTTAKKFFVQEQETSITINKSTDISQRFEEEFNSLVENEISKILTKIHFYIPSGRNYFSSLQSNVFSHINSNKFIDPFLIEFGSFYANFKNILPNIAEKEASKTFDKHIFSILSSNYSRKDEKEFLIHKDGRKVNLTNASSGQQEILPLLIVLKVVFELSTLNNESVFFIEEPEAHLFPSAQQKIVKLLARVFNSTDSNSQIILTTHSPYVLSSLNNLMYAGSLDEKLDKSKIKKLNRLVPKEERIDPKLVSAYSLDLGGKKRNLIDKETGLISQNYLDDVSNKISNQFGKLLDLEF